MKIDVLHVDGPLAGRVVVLELDVKPGQKYAAYLGSGFYQTYWLHKFDVSTSNYMTLSYYVAVTGDGIFTKNDIEMAIGIAKAKPFSSAYMGMPMGKT